MKHLPVIFLIFLLSGCNQAPKKEIPGVPYNPEDNFQTKVITVYNPIDTTSLLLVASDQKKTWRCEVYAKRINLLMHHFKDTLSISCDFSYEIKNNNLLYPFKLTTQDKSFSLEILAETCSGCVDNDSVFSNSSKKIIITKKETILKGCISKADTTAS